MTPALQRSEPAVYSRRNGAEPPPPAAVYVGRPTVYANPFKVTDATAQTKRERHQEVVSAYAIWLAADAQADLRTRIRTNLAGRDLVCWCQSPSDENPLPCHATVLLKIANAPQRERAR